MCDEELPHSENALADAGTIAMLLALMCLVMSTGAREELEDVLSNTAQVPRV